MHATVGASRRLFPHGEVIARQGEPVECLFLVTGGAVRLCAVAPSGREVVVGLLGAGDLFGEVALLGSGPSPVEARAVGDAWIVAIPVASLDAVVQRNPETATELLRLVAARLHRTSAALEEALAADVPTRVSRKLVDLAREHGEPAGAGVRIRVPLTQGELARMVGASREAVNRSLAALAARGLVRTRGRRLVISDPDALAREAGALEEAS